MRQPMCYGSYARHEEKLSDQRLKSILIGWDATEQSMLTNTLGWDLILQIERVETPTGKADTSHYCNL
jgi:hypothetical protein